MDAEYKAMKRRMSRVRVNCGKGASLEGIYFNFVLCLIFLGCAFVVFGEVELGRGVPTTRVI